MYMYSLGSILPLLILSVLYEQCSGTTAYRTAQGLTDVPGDIPPDTIQLFLNQNQITSLSDCQFCSLTQLKKLWLNANQITHISPSAFKDTILELLDLSGNKLTTVPSAALSYNASTLSSLMLEANSITAVPDGTFQGLSKLEILKMEQNMLEDGSMGESCFQGLYSIVRLMLGNNKLGGGIFSRITALSLTLQILMLDGNSMSDIASQPDVFVDSIRDMQALTHLSLSSASLTTVPDIYHNNANFSLTGINLWNNPLVCYRNVLWLKDVQEDPCINVVVRAGPCTEPAELVGREWYTLLREELDHPGKIIWHQGTRVSVSKAPIRKIRKLSQYDYHYYLVFIFHNYNNFMCSMATSTTGHNRYSLTENLLQNQ